MNRYISMFTRFCPGNHILLRSFCFPRQKSGIEKRSKYDDDRILSPETTPFLNEAGARD